MAKVTGVPSSVPVPRQMPLSSSVRAPMSAICQAVARSLACSSVKLLAPAKGAPSSGWFDCQCGEEHSTSQSSRAMPRSATAMLSIAARAWSPGASVTDRKPSSSRFSAMKAASQSAETDIGSAGAVGAGWPASCAVEAAGKPASRTARSGRGRRVGIGSLLELSWGVEPARGGNVPRRKAAGTAPCPEPGRGAGVGPACPPTAAKRRKDHAEW